ncbi:MAG: dihydrodipicolinate synthase family protein [Armatimonadota bacterium]|nr:dihydrodipicolinate synthase family protein [Armatimonadota bacterium]MDR7477604.1 dihydrodipicolinate synthase family protein [Armatimonadota bacterium]MDR7515486.1 dihydrodipicolinate synthase family protein [Armatimonadota bacterium]MDR7525907.1 dihydrodipicolinate synthase family protein [Armatimonadota bacterium]MDR7566339.1 dihydrodipicolinate synthase family protein [Armatimonadota bacterium]
MLDPQQLRGIVVPMATPLERDGRRVNPTGVRELVEHLVGGGVHAVFVAGTTGEGPALEVQEWARLVRTAVESVRGRVPVLAGVLAPATGPAVALARTAAELGADAVVATAPYYYPYSDDEILFHLRAVADAAELPVLLYNIPQNTRNAVSMGLCEQLAGSPEFVGLKDSSADLDSFRAWAPALRRQDPDFRLLLGTDHLLDVAILLGADGVVPSLANVVPRLLVEAFEAASAGDRVGCSSKIGRITQLMALYRVRAPQQAGIVTGIKCALEALGLPAGPPAAPSLPPQDRERRAVADVLRRLEVTT